MTATCYESGNDDNEFDNNNKSDNNDKFNNNEDKVYSFLRRWGWVGHVLDHMLDHMIIGLMTMALQLPSSLAWAPMNE